MPIVSPTDSLDRFRALLVADPALQRALAAIDESRDFVTTAIGAARERRIELDTVTLAAALRPDPLGVNRFDDHPACDDAWPSPDWLPVAVVQSAGQLAVDWLHFADARLSQPFYEDSIRRARRRPLNRLLRRRTSLSVLAAEGDERRVPDGFVFHMSRCGSTLVAQMIAALPGAVVISEAPPIDAVVQLAHARADIALDERVRLLRAMVAAIGRDRHGGAGPFVVKLDSWHSLALPLFRAAFPDTPWIFLYRDPVEVLVSHRRKRGMQTIPGTMDAVFGIEDGWAMPSDHYSAHALAAICDAAAVHHALGGGIMVDYAALPGALDSVILPHFGIAVDRYGSAAMAEAAAYDAKAPQAVFADDRRGKHEEADDTLRRIGAEYLEPHIARLRRLCAGL